MPIEIHKGSGNVYSDLRFPDPEAMQAKATVVVQMKDLIHSQQWSLDEAADLIGVPGSELAHIMRGHFRPFRVEDLTNWLTCLTSHGA